MPKKTDWKAVLSHPDYDEDFDFVELSVPDMPGWVLRAMDKRAAADGRSRASWVRQFFADCFKEEKAEHMPEGWQPEQVRPVAVAPTLPRRFASGVRSAELERKFSDTADAVA